MNSDSCNAQNYSINLLQDLSIKLILSGANSALLFSLITIQQISQRNLNAEYAILTNKNLINSQYAQTESSPEFKQFNRYSDVLAYRWNGIKLIDKNNKKEQFINANWIASPLVENETKQFIATQGPMVNTCSHFWQMVHQTNSKLVIAIIENEVIGSKCYAYWPRSDALVFGDWKVNSLDKQTNDLLINRKLNMANKSDGVNWELNHLHLYNWKDHQIVSNEFYDGYIDLLEMIWLTRQKHPNNPIIVHCSAGIGRT